MARTRKKADDPTWTESRHANRAEGPIPIDGLTSIEIGASPIEIGPRSFGELTPDSVFIERHGHTAIVPGRFVARSDDPTIPYDVFLKMSAGTDHKFTVDELTIRQRPGGPPVTTDAVHRLPLPTLCKAAVDAAAGFFVLDDRGRIVGPEFGGMDALRFPVGGLASPRRGRRGRAPRITDADLPRVAAVYEEGRRRHEGFIAVAEAFGVARSTAARAVDRARIAGYVTDETESGDDD